MAVALTMAAQRAGLAEIIRSVEGIAHGVGIVHTRRRIIRNEDEINALLVGPAHPEHKVNAWMVYPASNGTARTERHPGYTGIGVKGGGRAMTTFRWSIDGYGAIDDAEGSEETFQDLAFLVADTFNKYGIVAIPGVVMQRPANLEQFGYIALANFALFHYARIDIEFEGQTANVV